MSGFFHPSAIAKKLYEKTYKTSSSRTEHSYWKSDYGIMIYPQAMREQGEIKKYCHHKGLELRSV